MPNVTQQLLGEPSGTWTPDRDPQFSRLFRGLPEEIQEIGNRAVTPAGHKEAPREPSQALLLLLKLP